ncbi:uncharacterized protein PFL1_01454 [Pseudozyma flocculosa PF-1]|uniref:uncharacterized protein n=1 Tax=Pseudozyma flocculosa PF-1 TaxID=1277687 RepID=UPI0004560DCD|nr:uncharacterized protein PFL1_01454 [Pseudozyma flocculosa PF-1]EPQ31269.1 hypothetical protein PFL1_01454 [Pseudozyma flocculosa PF-1]
MPTADMERSVQLPHTPLNHFLKSAKARLAQHDDLDDAVYLVTSPNPTLDQVVAAIAYAYLQSQAQQQPRSSKQSPSSSSSTSSPSPSTAGKKVYIPVIQAKRGETLDASLPDLSLALQASLIAPENLTFLDDQPWRTATAYGRNKDAILVGGTAKLAATPESINEWEEVHGMRVVGLIDSDLPPTELAELQVTIVTPNSEVKGTDPETGLASLVALHFKTQLSHQLQASVPAPAAAADNDDDKQDDASAASAALLPKELADLVLAAVLVETDNLAESKTSYLDEGAIGFLMSRSSFHGPQAQATADDEEQASDAKGQGDNDDDDDDVYVPTFPDLDSFYRALKSAARAGAAGAATLGGLKADGGAGPARLPTHFEWNLIHGSTLPLVEGADPLPDFARKAIVGDFADILTSPAALKLLQPYGVEVGKAAVAASASNDASGSDTLDLRRISVADAVAAQLAGSASQGELLCIAVAALHAFVQINWTGPDLPSDLTPYALLRTSASDSFPPRKVEEEEMEKDARRIGRIVHRASLDALVFKGEPAYHLCQSPFFLVFAKAVLEALWQNRGTGVAALETLPWWRLRASTVHSHVLDEPASFGKSVFDPISRLVEMLEANRQAYDLAAPSASASASMPISTTTPAQQLDPTKNPWASLSARLVLERGVALQRLGNDREASEKFVEAARINGLRYRLGGALGKRTKYQKEAKTQLVLLAKSAVVDGGEDDEDKQHQQQEGQNAPSPSEYAAPEAGEEKLDDGWQAKADPKDQVAGMPSTYALNDDVLLEQTQFTSTSVAASASDDKPTSGDADDLDQLDPNSQPPLAVLDQCTLLALCLNIRNTQPSHGLTSNQMSSFISRVISHPRNWMVHTMSLLLRARLEATRTRTVERSVLQLQALIDQMPTNDSSLEERLKFFHALDLPPKWEMQAELARRYASLGVTRSALEIFERIELWEEVVQCLGLLGRQQEGVEIIRELLEGRKVEADVDVHRRKRLGLAVNDSTAQQVMFGRLDRARESKLWCSPRRPRTHAARWLRSALKINPLYTRSWFVLGCSYMRLERWKDAATCFRRCTALDEEDGESWNNLASCYLRMSEAQDAVDVESVGQADRAPALLDAGDDYDDDDDLDEDSWSLPSDGEELSDHADSGVDLSSTDESGGETETESGADTETEGDGEAPQRAAMRALGANRNRRQVQQQQQQQPPRAGRAGAAGPSYNLKLLAHRSLGKSLKFSHDNWRVWFNYMVVSVDVGMLSDATSALARVVELRTRQTGLGEADKEQSVDLAVLQRLVRKLFDETLLARISSSAAIYRQYARLLEWTGENAKAIAAHLNAYRAGAGNPADEAVCHDPARFEEACVDVERTVEVLLRLGPRPAQEGGGEGEGQGAAGPRAMDDCKYQARSLVRTFVARTKAEFEEREDWVRLKEMVAELR